MKRLADCFSDAARADGRTLPPGGPEALFATASAEGVLPALYQRLSDLGLLSQLPPGVAESLEAVSELNLERNHLILAQAGEIFAALKAAGIQAVALKGLAHLMSGVYVNLAARFLLDIDLLVPKEQLAQAVSVLSQAGYAPYLGDRLAMFRHHAPQMRQEGRIPVELHHAIGSRLAARILPACEIIEQAAGPLPSPEHLVIHNIVHSQIHHSYYDRIFPPLRAAYDLLLLERRFGAALDWRSIAGRFRRNGQLVTLQLHLLQVHETLGMALPFPIRLGPLAKLRRLRRRALNRYPGLRRCDPVYLVMSMLSRRLRLFWTIVSTPGVVRAVAALLKDRAFYRRLFADV